MCISHLVTFLEIELRCRDSTVLLKARTHPIHWQTVQSQGGSEQHSALFVTTTLSYISMKF